MLEESLLTGMKYQNAYVLKNKFGETRWRCQCRGWREKSQITTSFGDQCLPQECVKFGHSAAWWDDVLSPPGIPLLLAASTLPDQLQAGLFTLRELSLC